MGTTFKQPGEVMDFANDTGSDIDADSVVTVGDRVAVAQVNIADGETGSASVEGVHELPKADGEDISQGATVYWNGSAITTTSTDNTEAGYAFAAAAGADGTVMVKLNG